MILTGKKIERFKVHSLVAVTQMHQPTTSYIKPSKRNNLQNSTPSAYVNTAIQSTPSKVVQPSPSAAIGTRPMILTRYALLGRSEVEAISLRLNFRAPSWQHFVKKLWQPGTIAQK